MGEEREGRTEGEGGEAKDGMGQVLFCDGLCAYVCVRVASERSAKVFGVMASAPAPPLFSLCPFLPL